MLNQIIDSILISVIGIISDFLVNLLYYKYLWLIPWIHQNIGYLSIIERKEWKKKINLSYWMLTSNENEHSELLLPSEWGKMIEDEDKDDNND